MSDIDIQIINVEDSNDDFPLVNKELLERLKKDLDIRKLIKYNPSVEYLKGVQDTLDYLELKFNEQRNQE